MRLPPSLLAEGLEHVQRFSPHAQKLGIPLDAFALKFVLAHPEISTVIPGIKSPDQAERNSRASNSASLTSDDLTFLYNLFQQHFDAFLEELRTAG
jgi:aryl-alcohol dehydrogenase-like predicted oxidoreductase